MMAIVERELLITGTDVTRARALYASSSTAVGPAVKGLRPGIAGPELSAASYRPCDTECARSRGAAEQAHKAKDSSRTPL